MKIKYAFMGVATAATLAVAELPPGTPSPKPPQRTRMSARRSAASSCRLPTIPSACPAWAGFGRIGI